MKKILNRRGSAQIKRVSLAEKLSANPQAVVVVDPAIPAEWYDRVKVTGNENQEQWREVTVNTITGSLARAIQSLRSTTVAR